jgi:hypothetical protein
MFEFWIHSWQLSRTPTLSLRRADLDRACKKKEAHKYPSNFEVLIESAPSSAPVPSGVAGRAEGAGGDDSSSDWEFEREGAVTDEDDG